MLVREPGRPTRKTRVCVSLRYNLRNLAEQKFPKYLLPGTVNIVYSLKIAMTVARGLIVDYTESIAPITRASGATWLWKSLFDCEEMSAGDINSSDIFNTAPLSSGWD